MDEVKADQPAMDRFAARSLDRRDEFDRLRARMDMVRVHREAFGYIPGVGNRVHDAYDEFVDGCADAIASAAQSMASVSAAVRGAVIEYATSDTAAADALRSIETGMAGTDLRRLK